MLIVPNKTDKESISNVKTKLLPMANNFFFLVLITVITRKNKPKSEKSIVRAMSVFDGSIYFLSIIYILHILIIFVATNKNPHLR
jgi:hypothetical protein